MKVRVLAMLLALAPACAAHPGSPAGPTQTGPLRLRADIDRGEIAAGAVAVVTFRLENLSAQQVTLEFGSSCQIMPYAARRHSNEIVYPSGGGWACAAMMTQLTLPPHGVSIKEVTIAAGPAAGSESLSLPPGEYAIFAKLEGHKLESPRVALTVR